MNVILFTIAFKSITTTKSGGLFMNRSKRVGIAMEIADITLMTSDLNHVTKLIRISNATMTNIRENLFFAFIYNTLGVPIAAGILYPHFGILLSPVLASAMMSLSSVSVILNSLRLSRN